MLEVVAKMNELLFSVHKRTESRLLMSHIYNDCDELLGFAIELTRGKHCSVLLDRYDFIEA